MWIIDPKTKEPSVTLTLFVCGFIVCLLKLLTSGLVLAKMVVPAFTGSDFALAVGALGAVYTARRHSDNMTDSKDKE